MNKTGLVSISFRDKTPEEIIEYSLCSGIDAIEWGGDVHVPHGDIEKAKEVARLTLDAGLSMPEYGSYYIIGASDNGHTHNIRANFFLIVIDYTNRIIIYYIGG